MPHTIKATCPSCKKKANDYNDIEDKFGWRIVNEKKIPQSHCRKCRSKKNKNR